MKTRGSYSKISSRHRRPKHPGRYRVSFSTRAINSEIPITFSVVADSEGKAETVGFYESGTTPRRITLEVDFGDKGYIQTFAHGLPSWVNNPDEKTHPAIGFSAFEITGPLNEPN